MPFRYLTALALSLSALPLSAAMGQSVSLSPDSQARIEAYLASAETAGSSGGLLVAHHGEILISTGYGLAHRADGYPATPETVFDMGSLTKTFTAAAILVLQERGALSVEDRLVTFFPDIPADKADITLHHLLTHTSGLSDHTGGYEVSDWDPYQPRDAFLNALFDSPLSRPVGESLEYSNAGYGVLTAIIEDVSGSDYESFLNTAIFGPAGMDQTGYRQPVWETPDIAHAYFQGYLDPERADLGTFIDRWREEEVSWSLRGNGGLQTTLLDMEKWHRALLDGTLLSEETVALMEYPHAPWSEGDPVHYGYGWVVETGEPGTPVNHAGSNGLFNATIQRFTDDDLLIVHWTNESRPAADRMGRVVRQILLDPDYTPRPVHPSVYVLIRDFTETHTPDQVSDLPVMLENTTGRALEDRRILNRVGLYLTRQNQLDWAVTLLELNTALFPGDGNLYDSLGEAYFLKEDWDQARRAFEQALALGQARDTCHWCENARTRLSELDAASQ